MGIDLAKCAELKAVLESMPSEEAIVSIDRFFDGNDDIGSIGCNLVPHPGVDAFRRTLTGLLARPDVSAIYTRIEEIDPGEDYWPFTDTLFIVGKIPLEELREILSPLQPDEIGPAEQFVTPLSIKHRHDVPVLAAWWD